MRTVSLKKTCGLWRWKQMPCDALPIAHAIHYLVATPFSPSHPARHPRLSKIVQCAVKAPARPEERRCPRVASV